jgi:hypothetical protein
VPEANLYMICGKMVAAMFLYKSVTPLAVKRDSVGSLLDGVVIIAVMSPSVLVPATKSK